MSWRLVKQAASGDKGAMQLAPTRILLDFALPPRCAGCGSIVEEVGRFCSECWGQVDWLVAGVCERCGIPLEGPEDAECGACVAAPPRFDRLRAATLYDDVSRDLALRLKHGRQVALAKTMALSMRRQLRDYDRGERPILLPVPLHRWRLWRRGFNQAGLLAREISRLSHIDWSPDHLFRRKRTPALGGLNRKQRARTVSGAFSVEDGASLNDRTVILVDDVYTTGSTIEACVKALRKAKPGKIEAIVWARVSRPRYVE